MASSTVSEFRAAHGRLLRDLSGRAGAARWGLSENAFAEALYRSVAHQFSGHAADPAAVVGYLKSLQVEDLALASACMEGRQEAWEHFMAVYRANLRRAGRAIAGEAVPPTAKAAPAIQRFWS